MYYASFMERQKALEDEGKTQPEVLEALEYVSLIFISQQVANPAASECLYKRHGKRRRGERWRRLLYSHWKYEQHQDFLARSTSAG